MTRQRNSHLKKKKEAVITRDLINMDVNKMSEPEQWLLKKKRQLALGKKKKTRRQQRIPINNKTKETYYW